MKILGWIIAIPLILLALFILLRVLFCGPNKLDVRKMKPMAEKVSQYIITNGSPESLKNIPDLPYELVECRKTISGAEICKYDIFGSF